MLKPIFSSFVLPLEQTHTIDATKDQSLSTAVATRKIKDTNYGGQGERTTVVPVVQTIETQNSPSSVYADMASEAINGTASYTVSGRMVAKLQLTNLKGV